MTAEGKATRRAGTHAVRGAVAVLGVLLGAIIVAWVWSALITLPGERTTPAGRSRNFATYVTTKDGTRLAVDVWFPADYDGRKLATIFRGTRYGRSMELAALGRILARYGYLKGTESGSSPDVATFNRAGFAFVVADGKGSGASFGRRRTEAGPDEMAGYADVMEWIAKQDWSNGVVGAYGISQDGDNAEMAASRGVNGLRAIAPLYISFDSQLETIGIGGLYNRQNVIIWAEHNKRADANEAICPEHDFWCWLRFRLLYRGAKPVDGPEGHALLDAAVSEHINDNVVASWGRMQYRDDSLGATGLTMADIMPFGAVAKLEAIRIPYFSFFGWQDAGLSKGALNRYLNNDDPMEIVIGPWSHGGLFEADPFREKHVSSNISLLQKEVVARYFKSRLGDEPPPPKREIMFNVLGTRLWQTTTVWPPPGYEPRVYYFAKNGQADVAAPAAQEAYDHYVVDYSAGTGPTSRWRSIVTAGDISYPDRAERTAKLLHYDTPPMARDEELTGSPIVHLFVSSSREDAAFFVYLDDVAPDGRVTYLSEAVLRGIFRNSSPKPVDYKTIGVNRSFYRADASLMKPGNIYEIDVDMFPVSALIAKGHKLRFSLAGADVDAMPRVPARGPAPDIHVYRGTAHASSVEVPLEAFDPGNGETGSEQQILAELP